MAINTVSPGCCGAFEQVNATAAAVSLTAATYAAGAVVATKAVILVTSPASTIARWRADGVTAGALTGMPVDLLAAAVTGDHERRIELSSAQDIANFSFVTSAAGVSATLHVNYYR